MNAVIAHFDLSEGYQRFHHDSFVSCMATYHLATETDGCVKYSSVGIVTILERYNITIRLSL